MAADREGSDQDSEEREAGGGSVAGFAMGVVFGALLGAGLALLYAPERGDKTRRYLRRRLSRLREDTEEGLGRMSERARKELVRRGRRFEAGIDRAAERARDVLD